MNKKTIKVLHCPLNNSNERWVLSRAERRLGLQSDLVVLIKNPYYNTYDKLLNIESVSLPNEVKRIKFLYEAIKKYDVFHFNFGQSIWDHPFYGFNYLDLPLIKRAGKKIVMTFQGDDIRNKGLWLKKFGAGPYGTLNYSFTDKFFDFNRQLRLKKISRYADQIFAISPDLLNFLPKTAKLLPTMTDLDLFKQNNKKRNSSKIKIIHAPSDRVKKGTAHVIRCIKKLSSKYPLEFTLIENMTNQKALEFYKEADLAVDQLLIGWYGVFAVEMMALSKPVIAFLRPSDLEKYVPFRREIPVVSANPNNLEEVLIGLIENLKLREKIGKQSRKYVEKYHNPLKIAAETKKLYEKLCVE